MPEVAQGLGLRGSHRCGSWICQGAVGAGDGCTENQCQVRVEKAPGRAKRR